ncbi:MAG: hypothetical protein JNL82_29290 [Myxococcales bacterium]|nr:hypothetical protein [Myxococcales bacterium]
MSAQRRLRELKTLLTLFRDHWNPSALVIRCADEETLYVVHTLEQLDAESPSDRIVIITDPFLSTVDYLDKLDSHVASPGAKPDEKDSDAAARLRCSIERLTADLSTGDHRLVLALIPTSIHDPEGFTVFLESFLREPLSTSLRLVVRDDSCCRIFELAAASRLEEISAFRFQLPAAVVTDTVMATARNQACEPEDRAQAILQLATMAYGYGDHETALKLSEYASKLSDTPALVAYKLALQADIFHATGQFDEAVVSACRGLRLAAEGGTAPLIYNIAMRLGAICSDLVQIPEAVACFRLAERYTHSYEAQEFARQQIDALKEVTC